MVTPHFLGRWIGRRPSKWPTRSSELIPLDFFICGNIKSKLFATQPQLISDLIKRIIELSSKI